MENAEKFKEVFGFKPDTDACVMPNAMCLKAQEEGIITSCAECSLYGFWHKEYKSCFRLREDIDDGK